MNPRHTMILCAALGTGITLATVIPALIAAPQIVNAEPQNDMGRQTVNIGFQSTRLVDCPKVTIGSVWRVAGANPWRGGTYCALLMMHIAPEIAEVLTQRIERGADSGIVTLQAGLIRGPGREFLPRVVGSFGNTISYQTTIAFRGEQRARLYAYRGVYIAVPVVCGNVLRVFQIAPPSTDDIEERDALIGPFASRPEREELRVPEPATWALVALGLVGISQMRKA